MAGVAEPQLKLARDLIAIALADGEITPEEEMAISKICELEGIDKNRLYETLHSNYNNDCEGMPTTFQEKKDYLMNIIKMIGIDGHAAPEEIYLFQIIAGKMGLNQMNVIGMFLATANHQHFKGNIGSKVFSSFLENYIDPRQKTENANRENLRVIYDTVVSSVQANHDGDIDKDFLCQNLARATEAFLENKILINEFAAIGIDFTIMVKQEEARILERYVSVL